MADDRPQGVAHETGKGKHKSQPERAVTKLGGEKQQAEITHQGNDHARMGQFHGHRSPGAQRAEQQRHRKQHVGIADHLVGGKRRGCLCRQGLCLANGTDRVHGYFLPLSSNTMQYSDHFTFHKVEYN